MFKRTFIFILALFSSLVNAATIDFNFTATSSLFTANNGTQTEWLHLSESTNYSYNDIITELGNGGVFEGYTLAARADVGLVTEQLFGWNWSSLANGYNTAYQGYTDQAATVWGYSDQAAYHNQVTGLTSDFSSGYPVQLAANDPTSSIDPNYDKDLIYSLSIIDPTSSGHYFGSFLYKDVAPVPIPAAAWLFGSGLLGLIGFSKRKKATA